MHSNQKINLDDWYMKIDLRIRIAADFQCMNVPVESNNDYFMDKLLVNKAFAIGYKIAKKFWLW